MPVIEGTDRIKVAVGEYEFAVDGGGVGTIPLRAGAATLGGVLPSGALIAEGYVEVDTPVTAGAGATLALGVEAAGDVQPAAVFTGAPWNTAGRKALPFSPSKPTQARGVRLDIAVAAVTAGKFRVILLYR